METQGYGILKVSFRLAVLIFFFFFPQTGKTTGAAIYGRILKHLNFLSNGNVVLKAASDFIGNHVGESQTKTNQILESARGKV